MFVDSHCHLSSEEIYNHLDEVVNRAHMVGVQYFLNAGGKFDELERQIEICHRFAHVWTVTGVHPHDALHFSSVKLDEVLLNAQKPEIVAIGECGLDYFYDFAPKDIQIKIFKMMIEAAQESGLPIIIHTRDAEADTIELLSNAYKRKPFKGVIHCYSSTQWLAQEALKLGFYISASGMITFKNADNLRDSFKIIPVERLLLETDTPYLAPVPMRGKTNEPSYIVHTAGVLADIKGMNLEDLERVTTQNFFDLFDKAKNND